MCDVTVQGHMSNRRHGILLVVKFLLKVYFKYFERDLRLDKGTFLRWEFEGNEVPQPLAKITANCVSGVEPTQDVHRVLDRREVK